MLFVCALREPLRRRSVLAYPDFAFGCADPFGIVGESLATWKLRNDVLFAAGRAGHVLIHGASGTGKELAARAVHGLSKRGSRQLVARNAATLPETLIDAELFGNAKNYPNPGMPDRPGLIGQADGSSLFLDEIAELPFASQAHLLRVLDGGEYQRLGESTPRVSDFRLLAATNREPAALKHDLLARFDFNLKVPELTMRKEDIPLLIRHLLRHEAERGDEVALGRFPGGDPRQEPLLSLALVRQLLSPRYSSNVRELRAQLWEGLRHEKVDGPSAAEPTRTTNTKNRGPTPERIQQCLNDHNGVIELTWKALGLPNRFALLRLIRKHKIEVRKRTWARVPRIKSR
jgi:transcriptional regulator with GAF, ATPase, and Fis domain